MGEVSGSRFGSGANFPRLVTTEWECPSCGTKQVGNVAQGCTNAGCSTHGLAGVDSSKYSHEPRTTVDAASSQIEIDLFHLLEAHGLWQDGKYKMASGEVWDRAEVKARLWPQAPAAAEDQEVRPVMLAVVGLTPTSGDAFLDLRVLERTLTDDETRTIIAGLQLIAENFPGDNAPEGMLSGNHAAALAAELTRK